MSDSLIQSSSSPKAWPLRLRRSGLELDAEDEDEEVEEVEEEEKADHDDDEDDGLCMLDDELLTLEMSPCESWLCDAASDVEEEEEEEDGALLPPPPPPPKMRYRRPTCAGAAGVAVVDVDVDVDVMGTEREE